MLRARSDLRPSEDGQLIPLFTRLINDVQPSLQAWRTFDRSAATAATYRLSSVVVNPYAADAADIQCQSQVDKADRNAFPRINAMMASGELSPVLEILDHWQRRDPMSQHLRRTLKKSTDQSNVQVSRVIRPHVDAAVAAESRDADRSQVRALIRDKLAGVDIPFDVRAFVGTVWAEYLTLTRQTEGSGSHTYATAVHTMEDMLWSIAAKERAGQKARLSKMIPPLVQSLRIGAAVAQVSGEKMKRFL